MAPRPSLRRAATAPSGGTCRSCGHYDSCRGGCMAAKFFTGLPLDGPDPECVLGHGQRPSRGRRPRRPAVATTRAARRAPVTLLPRRPERACDESPLTLRSRPRSPWPDPCPSSPTRWRVGTPAPPLRGSCSARTSPTWVGRGLSERHVAYYRVRAEGGAGIVVTETASVHPSDWPYERAPLAENCHRAGAEVADACHGHGTLVLAGLGTLRRPRVQRLLAVGDVGAVGRGRRGQSRDAGGHGRC